MTGFADIKIPKFIEAYTEDDEFIYIPRHFDQDPDFIGTGIELKVTNECWHEPNHAEIKWREGKSLREYQRHPAMNLIDHGQLLHAPCGSGKTVIGIHAICAMGVKTAIVIDVNILASQWKDRLKEFTTLQDAEIGLVGDGEDSDGKVVICFIQTLLRRPYKDWKAFYNQFPLVIVDECHSTGSSEFFKVLNRFPGRRIGLTATIERTDKLKTFMWSIGMKIIPVHIEMLRPDVYLLPTETDLTDKVRWFRHMNSIILGRLLVKDWKRNKKIKEFVQGRIDAGRNIILLTHSRTNAKYFYDTLNCERKALLVGAKSGKKDETKRVDHDDPQLICATFQFLSKGFDNDKMDTIVYVTPFNAANSIEQSAGRIRRFRVGKPTPAIYDIYDPKTADSYDAARARQAIYSKFGFNIRRPLK
jgi:superfamily II DNA or RNA helicase